VEHVQTAPDFRRRLVRRENQSVIVDLVSDSAPQGPQPKNRFGGVRVDPPEEILANKLCALFSRAELRDPLDVLVLERAGFRSQDTIPLASRKDADLTSAQLAWVLSQVTVGDDAAIPGGVSPTELRAFLTDLIARLTSLLSEVTPPTKRDLPRTPPRPGEVQPIRFQPLRGPACDYPSLRRRSSCTIRWVGVDVPRP
jgi:hypothetical protein